MSGLFWSVPSFPGYSISESGVVKTTKRGPERVLSPWMNRHGYWCVALYKEGKRHVFCVHALVLMVFRGPRPTPSHHACHDDGSRCNNHISNLRWDTIQGNFADKKLHGTQFFAKGSLNGASKLTEDSVRTIKRRLSRGERVVALAREHGVSHTQISNIKNGKIWKHVALDVETVSDKEVVAGVISNG